MMSEKSSKPLRSKIPRFQGARKKTQSMESKEAMTKSVAYKGAMTDSVESKVAVTESVESKVAVTESMESKVSVAALMESKVALTESVESKMAMTESVESKLLDQRAKEMKKSDCLSGQNISKVLDADKSNKRVDVGDVPFELDHEALSSILTNKGIVTNSALRASEMPLGSSLCTNSLGCRLSMRESLNDFKEKLKLYRKFQQYENSRTESNPEAQTGILNDKNAAMTPRRTTMSPGYSQQRRTLTLTESLEEHKKNIRIFKEKMQSYDNAILTPRKPGNQIFNEFTPRQRQMANNMRIFSSATSKNNFRKEMVESKENTSPGERRHPTAFSTSKKTRVRFNFNEEPRSLFLNANKEKLYSEKSVRRPLLPSLLESEETEKTINLGGSEQMLKESCSNVCSKESCSNVNSKESLKDYESARNHLVISTVHQNQGVIPGLPTTVFNSPLFMSAGILKSCSLTATSATISSPLYHNSAANSSQYSWACQDAVNTPCQSQDRFLTNISAPEPTNFKTPATSNIVFEPDWLKSSSTFTKVAESFEGKNGYANLSEAFQIKKVATSSQSLSADLNDCFSKLDLTSRPSQNGPSTLQKQIAAASLLHQLKTTPTCQAQRTPRTPTTPFLCRPPMRVQTASSSLKFNDGRLINSPNCLPQRTAATSVKKLRWADIQN